MTVCGNALESVGVCKRRDCGVVAEIVKCYTKTAFECIATNACDTVGNRNRGKGITVGERISTNACDTVSNLNPFNAVLVNAVTLITAT